ncbi:uroporphyrinogen-III synthase [Chitinophaga silvatica]|uniref:Uroporphyrinogen-III synthase n=1 Tax=Chitinophaga silvatica TaxID=2282649 RepID=A0A3E1Y4X2_9BACT|nr:uroporphyrinogen-III synthase [Chitinophaga silvatica]RFS19745.1 uroporphyrinogen-III synthase [Chitinophaga silvatica]
MSNHKYRILCTRPLADQLIKVADAKGLMIDVKHFIQIKPLINQRLLGAENMATVFAPGAIQVFTSAHAVTTLEHCYLNQEDTHYVIENAQICCISGNTRNQAERVFKNATILADAAYGKDLAKAIIALPDIKAVNFFCGNQRRNELPDTLTQAGITINEFVIYENIPTPEVSDITYDGILFFSPSAVKSFFSANRIPSSTVCFAIGTTTAEALQTFTDNKIISSTDTSEESMVHTAIFYFNNINCYE